MNNHTQFIIKDGVLEKVITDLEVVQIPDEVVTIKKFAIAFNDIIKKIIFPDSLLEIQDKAIYECSCIEELFVPKSVKSIGKFSFDLANVERISVDKDNLIYDSREDCNAIIEKKSNTLLYGCCNSFIPSSVKAIGEGAFTLSKIKNIHISEGVTVIGEDAFRECEDLQSVTMADSVTCIKEDAFRKCDNLQTVRFSNNLETIKSSAFFLCRKLDIDLPESLIEIGFNAFSFCSLSKINIGKNVQHISISAFGHNHSLMKIEVDPENKHFDSRNDCNAIIETETNSLLCACQNTTIPKDIECIRTASFDSWHDLTSITIPSSVKNIGRCTFENAEKLKHVIIQSDKTFETVFDFYTVEIIESFRSELKTIDNKKQYSLGAVSIIGREENLDFDLFKEHIRYIKLQSKKQELWKLCAKYETLLKGFYKLNLLNEEMYEWLLENADKSLCPLILHLKELQYPSSESFEREEKKFDSEMRYLDQLSDTSSFAYLKTQFRWKVLPDNTVKINSYVGNGEVVKIPETIQGRRVSTISNRLFKLHNDRNTITMTKLILPEGLEVIEKDAFRETKINELTIPSTVKCIGQTAFCACSNLKKIKFYDNGKISFGKNAFLDCPIQEVEYENCQFSDLPLDIIYEVANQYLCFNVDFETGKNGKDVKKWIQTTDGVKYILDKHLHNDRLIKYLLENHLIRYEHLDYYNDKLGSIDAYKEMYEKYQLDCILGF